MMKRIFTAFLVALVTISSLCAQETKEEFVQRYNLLVNRMGAAGVGVETLLDKWEKAYPGDVDMLSGKFMFYLAKATSTEVKTMSDSKYMGQKPILTLKDSLGNPVNYFQVSLYDDELFGKALTYIDQAIVARPEALDLRHAKISSYISYEGLSPDIATAEIISLIDYNASQQPEWTYTGIEKVDQKFFEASIQDFCFNLFNIGGEKCWDAFKNISERMLIYNSKNILFLDNIGSYYLVAKKDNKKALKYYKKVLKIEKGDMTALKNIILMARNSKDVKLEKKYLKEIIKYSPEETEKQSAQVRLDALS